MAAVVVPSKLILPLHILPRNRPSRKFHEHPSEIEAVACGCAPSAAYGQSAPQTTPPPVMNLSALDNVISWIIPSLDFNLQQSPDLLNWTDMTNVPFPNFTNLENQVALPSPVENSFFRLKH
jgi:hypothetical protein